MLKTVCVKHCAEPFCVAACPSGALVVSEGQVKVESDKCHGCGICRVVCMTWGCNKTLERKLPWVSIFIVSDSALCCEIVQTLTLKILKIILSLALQFFVRPQIYLLG